MIILYTLVGIAVAAFAVLSAIKLNNSKKSKTITEARKRAEGRVTTRAFADTRPDFDPFRTSIQFQTAVPPAAYDPDLTDTQVTTISRVLGIDQTEWYSTTTEKTQFDVSGYHVLETIELKDPWKNTTR